MFVPNTYLEFLRIMLGFGWTGHHLWLGFTDAAMDGIWVVAAGPFAGQDVSDIIWWAGTEPNGGKAENCAAFLARERDMADYPCNRV